MTHRLVPPIVILAFTAIGCTQASSNSDKPAQSPESGEVNQFSNSSPANRRVRQSHSSWWTSEETAKEVAVTEVQLEQLKEMKARLGARVFQQRNRERKSYMRLVRLMGQDPYPTELIEKFKGLYEEVILEKHRINVERLEETRRILGSDQWKHLIDVDPGAVQIGSFRLTPPKLITITDGTPIPTTPTPPMTK